MLSSTKDFMKLKLLVLFFLISFLVLKRPIFSQDTGRQRELPPTQNITQTPTNTIKPTNTLKPTNTPKPTSTPKNTPTPKPSPTPTPTGIIDLKIETLSHTGTNLKTGDKTTLKAIIKNEANTSAKNFKIKFFANSGQIFEKNISSLTKNAKKTITFSYAIDESITSDFIFSVQIDPDNTIAETNEDNNLSSHTVPVSPATKNLIIESFTPSSTHPKPGQKISWKVKVKNIGNSKASQIKINLLRLNQIIGSVTISSLAPNATTTKSISDTVPVFVDDPSNYQVGVIIDPNNSIVETDESDNSQNYSLSLKVSDLFLELGEYMSLNSNQTINSMSQFRVVVKNNDIQSLNNVKLAIFYSLNTPDSPKTKITDATLNLAKKASLTHMFDQVQSPSTATLGTLVYYFIQVDPDNNISESTKSNNLLTFKRTIVEKPPQAIYPYLSISVYDPDGVRLNGATVKLTNGSDLKTKTTGSDPLSQNSAGNVIFDALPNTATFNIDISKSGYRTLSQTVNYSKFDDDGMYRTYDLDQKSALSGTVTNSSGQPLSYVSVKVEGTSLEPLPIVMVNTVLS